MDILEISHSWSAYWMTSSIPMTPSSGLIMEEIVVGEDTNVAGYSMSILNQGTNKALTYLHRLISQRVSG
jgi:hypothetical protein